MIKFIILYYNIIEFTIVDFLHFLDKDVKSTYQRTKLMKFFKDLQELPPFVEKFSDSEFQSSIMFLLLKLTKQGQPIPVGAPNRFNLFSNHTDFLDV